MELPFQPGDQFLQLVMRNDGLMHDLFAQLQTEQAEADKRIAQAKAEERKAMAMAAEQEMKAKVQEMRAKVVEAEAELPRAMAEAFREGRLGIMDYYNMLNVQADTEMRKSIGQVSDDKSKTAEGLSERQQKILNVLMKEFSKK